MGAGASVPSDVAACELELTIVAGKDLIAKDGGMFSKATSDPFVKATIGHMVLGQTPHVENNLNPEWNADLCTDTDVSAAAMQGGRAILLEIFDYDAVSGSDPMGVVSIDVADLVDGRPLDKWLDVMPCDGCKKAKGQLHVMSRRGWFSRRARHSEGMATRRKVASSRLEFPGSRGRQRRASRRRTYAGPTAARRRPPSCIYTKLQRSGVSRRDSRTRRARASPRRRLGS